MEAAGGDRDDERWRENDTAEPAGQGVAGTGAGASVPLHSAPLLVNAAGSGWSLPTTTSWHNEATLRDLLVDNPSLMPGVADPAVAAVKEFGLPGVGRVDVVAVESSGTITVCEAKLATNAEMRRTVVGQVLAYVSGLARFDLDEFEAAWHRHAGVSLLDAVLGDAAPEPDQRAFRDAIAQNLAHGRFRVMLAVDVLSTELQAVVAYLATHMDVDVVALELAYARAGEVEILVPRSYGSELSASRAVGQGTRGRAGYRRDVADVRDALVQSADTAAPGFGSVVGAVLDRLGKRIDYLYSGDDAMLDPVLVADASPQRQPAKIITTQRTIGVRVCFHWCRQLDPTQLEAALVALEAHPAIAPLVDGVRAAGYRRGPMLGYYGVLDQPGALDALVDALTILASTNGHAE